MSDVAFGMPDIQSPENGGDGGFGAGLRAYVDVQIGKLSDSVDGVTSEVRKLRRDARRMPSRTKVVQSLTFQSAGSIIAQPNGSGIGVILGGPDIGYQWSVRQICVGGPLLSTGTVAGQAWYLVSAGIPDTSLTNVIDQASVLPDVATYGVGEFPVMPNENVWVVFTGVTNGQNLVTVLTFQQSPYLPAEETTAEV